EAKCNSGLNDIHRSDGFSLVIPKDGYALQRAGQRFRTLKE
nr:hypothetical protein [Tanacetum cinerariifolium]